VPEAWRERAGVMMPLYQAEAMWISFHARWGSRESYPCAVKVAAGKINAISGKPWKPELAASERDYIVVPEQPWLDGFCVAKDVIGQFVAMPLGSGYSVEEQITGKPEHGGLQLIVYPMLREYYQALLRQRERSLVHRTVADVRSALLWRCAAEPARAMGLAAGGRMGQQIYADPHGLDAWDQSISNRCFVTLVDAQAWREITGEAPPTKPPTAADYSKAGLPWFNYYADLETLGGAPALTRVKAVAEVAAEKGEQVLGPDGEVNPDTIITIGPGETHHLERIVHAGTADAADQQHSR
jgi:hypothetical protein